MNTSYFWGIAALLFGLIEVMIPGLVSVWFAVGALGALLVTFVTDNLYVQFFTFLILSIISLVTLRKMAGKISKNPTNDFGRVIGKEVKIKGIDGNGNYKVYLDGKEWSGKSENKFEIGEIAKVISIDGVKLVLGR